MAATHQTGVPSAKTRKRRAQPAAPEPLEVSVARMLADALARVVEINVVDPAGGAFQIFRSSEMGLRLDMQAAALVARHGLKAQVVEDWLRVAKLPKQGLYAGLRLTPSTLSRKRKGDTLDPAVTERLVRQSELMVKAAEVFGEGASKWMAKAHPLLGGQTPVDAASNEYGGARVRQILNAIEHGGVV